MDKSFSQVGVTVDETDPRDPGAQCDRCGRRGTVARAMRHSQPPLVFRYCSACWPEAQQELEARQGEAFPSSSAPVAWSSSSRSWHDTRSFLILIATPPSGGSAPTSMELAVIAQDIRAKAAEMDGPIPSDIQDFLDRHLPPAA
jgi:hypothetical protein